MNFGAVYNGANPIGQHAIAVFTLKQGFFIKKHLFLAEKLNYLFLN